MDNNIHEKMEEADKRNTNTEYLPTKCRITKPPPPKPATNPLQFVKISTCPLTRKAQEQIKKVEEIKTVKKEVREEAEDWQANLDNWKSCRRKRQEHIIERVVEVKKFEQEEQDRGRRKSKTFSEMIGDRSKGRHKYAIPIYDEDSNDLSDYGIGSSSSKANSVKDVDTDDSSSILDDKDNNAYESSNKDTSSASNQSQSEDETQINKKTFNSILKEPNHKNNYPQNLYSNNINVKNAYNSCYPLKSSPESKVSKSSNSEIKEEPEQYTYEGAIQNYRSRIKSKINVDESVFNKSQEYCKSKEANEAQSLLPKGNLFKKKEIFESDRNVEIGHLESPTSRRLSEELVNAQSIKDRLKSLEQFTEQPLKITDKYDLSIKSVKERLQDFNKQNDSDTQNNNYKPLRESVSQSNINKISNYLLDKSNSHSNLETKNLKTDWRTKDEIFDRSSSPETELYMNKLNMFSRDLDTLMYGKLNRNINDLDYIRNPNDLIAVSSDREDSGIHTADVSCSVSQADEQLEENELTSNMIPKCIEKLQINNTEDIVNTPSDNNENDDKVDNTPSDKKLDELINVSTDFINSEKKHYDIIMTKTPNPQLTHEKCEKLEKNTFENKNVPEYSHPVIYENVEIKPCPSEFQTGDLFGNPAISLAPPKHIQPPKEKPPPPPPSSSVDNDESNLKRLNSTKRLKKEMQIKRSSFLGLDEPLDDQLDLDLIIEKPPDINFFRKESNLEKPMYKKFQSSREGGLSEVESQDSGLEIERGRLSSDTWCSSLIDSSTPVHNRQDSGQTNSFTSEEEEIMKKEREIIEMIEKEEKSRDGDCVNQSCVSTAPVYENNAYVPDNHYDNNLGSDKFASPYIVQHPNYPNNIEDQDSEVLKVEHELLQLEREELERKRDSIIFRENQARTRQQNRYSLENICDNVDNNYQQYSDYRKSMPELQHLPNDIRKSMTDEPNYIASPSHYELQYHKSMPDIQRSFNKSVNEYSNISPQNNLLMIDHQKSMPELQIDIHRNNFRSTAQSIPRQPIMPGKPLRPLKGQRDNKEDRLLMMKPIEPDSSHNYQRMRSLPGNNIHMLAAAPKSRNLDNWIQPKANPEIKSYNQHWLIQEAELRRLSEQKSPQRNWPPNRIEKHIPEPIIQKLTQRVQNRSNLNERNQRDLRHDQSPNKENLHHPYLGHSQTVSHASLMPCPPGNMEETPDKMLSVSGKKKCSSCNNFLGRGAAMIIETLCLFYHMECFKCCVCHIQLGDGLIGTDVRVRNQKLHCHNCYSSDDGVKFSCV